MGCAPPHSFPCNLYIDSDFNDEEFVLIEQALHEWEIATNGIVEFNITIGDPLPSQDHYIQRHYSYEEKVKELDHEDGAIIRGHAWYTRNGWFGSPGPIWIIVDNIAKTSWIEREQYNVVFKHVVRHELGHHLGLDHPKYPPDRARSVMFPFEIASRCITVRDLEAFCSLYSCDYKTLHSTCDAP